MEAVNVMGDILNAIREVNKSIIATLVSILVIISLILAVMYGQGAYERYSTVQNITILILFIPINISIVTLLLKRIMCMSNFEKCKEYKELMKLSYEEEFNETIDQEMRGGLIGRYENRSTDLYLFITNSWFIFLSKNGSIIRKNRDIIRIYREVINTHGVPDHSLDTLIVKFSDRSIFSNQCFIDCDEIIELCKERLTHVKYESG